MADEEKKPEEAKEAKAPAAKAPEKAGEKPAEKAANGRRPSALKRDLQADKRRLAHRSFKAEVATAIRGFKESVSQKDSAAATVRLQEVYSLMDKGVKTGVYKVNKAGRTKSRLAQQVSA